MVVGAGHAGLAASHFLSARGIDHLVLERGEVANSWRRERWDSLRLLTPNWLTRLPGGHRYQGPDPDGYLTAGEVADFIDGFAKASQAPVRTGVEVLAVRPAGAGTGAGTETGTGTGTGTGSGARTGTGSGTRIGYRVQTDQGEIHTRTVVIASGACNLPSVPGFASAVPESISQLTPFDYAGPDALPDGGVLVVGASATGVQLAAEIARSGRPVTLSVGEHVRLPRTYRGRDVLWWMHAAGVWDQRHDQLDDLERARGLPSPQLAGTPGRSAVDLNALMASGVEPVGRWAAIRDGRALFSGGLRNVCSLADLKMARLLSGFDEWATAGLPGLDQPAEALEPTRVPASPRLQLDLRGGEIRTVLWATGFRPDYRWLDVPVVDAKGRLRHVGGVVDSPGLYALGLPVLRRRKSTFIHGAEDDAREVVDHLADYLAGRH
ncbi:NAD(P)/FAD-dependent oxidoreductase [Catenulispora yoronensis]|uniref:NAD(P)/FAD-dependent oxidoreductase n=1 Tax=Catenulispora yoronensis TaxID=450799 RepID=A0ABN2VCM4_9ACTN